MTFGKRSGAIAAVVTGATLVPLVAFGGVGLAKNSPSGAQYQYPGANQYKVTICHHTHSKKKPTHTITVSANAVKAHLKHGDTLGACATTAPAASTPKHADNGNHGNGNNGNHGKKP
jgi:hypothetical protein